MKRAWAVSVAILTVLLGFVGWRFATKAAEANQLARQQQARKGAAAQVSVATAGPRVLLKRVELVGNVESPFVAKLSPRETGRLIEVLVREGDPVAVGQILARMDPAQIDAQVLQQQSALAEARSRLAEASVAQVGNDVGIESSIRVQKAGVKSSQADLEQTRQTMNAKLQTDQNNVTDAEAKVKLAKASLQSARTSHDSAKANLENAKVRSARLQSLEAKGYVSLQDLEDARTTVTVQENLVKVAEQSVNAAQAAVESADAQLNAARQSAAVNKKKLGAELTASEARNAQNLATYDAARANRGQTEAYRKNISALRASVGSAEAQLREVESRRADLLLRSPIEGTVTARSADPGDVAGPGNGVLTVQYLKWLYVTASAPVDLSRFVQKGATVEVSFDAFPGETLRAPVEKINPAADPVTRQFTFRIRLDNPALRFRPGMFARVRLTTEQVKADVAVPREAVKNGSTFVLTKDGTVEQRTVEIGAQDSSLVEIKSGVRPGEQVVVLSYAPLRDGQKAKAADPVSKK